MDLEAFALDDLKELWSLVPADFWDDRGFPSFAVLEDQWPLMSGGQKRPVFREAVKAASGKRIEAYRDALREGADARRVVSGRPECFARVRSLSENPRCVVHVALRDGRWMPMLSKKEGDEVAAQAVASRLAHEERAAAGLLEAPASEKGGAVAGAVNRRVREKTDSLARIARTGLKVREGVLVRNRIARALSDDEAPGVREISDAAFNDRSSRPVLPLLKGGAWDLKAGRAIDGDEMRELLLTHGGALPEIEERDGSVDTPQKALMRDELEVRFAGLFERTAALLTGTTKCIDLVKCDKASVGKTTWYTLVTAALPGCVKILNAKNAFRKNTDRFSPAQAALANCFIVMVDEVGQEGREIAASDLHDLTDSVLSVETKGKDVITRQRIGTLVLAGHAWPSANSRAQGIKERVQWAYIYSSAVDAMPQETRDALFHPSALAYLRYRLVRHAGDLLRGEQSPFVATQSVRSRHAVDDWHLGATPPMPRWLLETHERDDCAFVFTKELLEEIVEEQVVDKREAHPRALAAAMRTAFPGIKNRRKTEGMGWPVKPREKTGEFFVGDPAK